MVRIIIDKRLKVYIASVGSALVHDVLVCLRFIFLEYDSWRNSTNGSSFIQALSSCMQEYTPHEMDFLRMLERVERVNSEVVYNLESIRSDPRKITKKQNSCVISTLTKELYLCPKNNQQALHARGIYDLFVVSNTFVRVLFDQGTYK